MDGWGRAPASPQERVFGIEPEDSNEEKLGKLENGLAEVDFSLAEAMPLLSGLLSIPLTERFPALAMAVSLRL